MKKSLELRRQRAALIAAARAIVEAAEAENRDLSAEEQVNYDQAFADAEELRGRIERLEAVEAAGAELGDSANGAHRGDPQGGDGARVPAFGSRGLLGLDAGWHERGEWRGLMQTTQPEYRQAFRHWLRTGELQQRALQADVNTSGGYLVTPMQFVDELIKDVDNMVFVRQRARVFSVPTADSLGAPSLESDPADPTWTSELAIGTEDSSMGFGRRELRPHPLAKYIKLSNTLLRKVPNAEALVRGRLAYKFAVVDENAFLNGSGSQQPLGVFTASNDGIPASRDVSTDNTTTEISFDNLINVKYTLKAQYWPEASWTFHRDAMKMISKLVDGNGQYIWRQSIRENEPDMILGHPVDVSEYAPNTFTTGLYVGLFGAWSNYWIADALDMQMQRLVELFAATNQVAIVGRRETDGMPVKSEAFVRVKLA
ncbi:MAG: phage major capsid protein [Caldilineaceae bacterium]|nr:phage major capsid protein [Caldilineaceae bacterium]